MANELAGRIAKTAFAFRGYNLTNLGRSRELLAHRQYGPLVELYLREAGDVASEVLGKRVRLVERVRAGRETTLRSYGDAIAVIMAMEFAQIELLRRFHGVEYGDARLAYGYSLGELAALGNGGVFGMADALKVPLAMSSDMADLAANVTLGVVFSRGPAVSEGDVQRLCQRVNLEGRGVIGVSAVLSPNTVLVMGQRDTVKRFKRRMPELFDRQVHLRPNTNRWPPMHTPIVWQRNIPCRSGNMMHTLPGGFSAPDPPVLSLVTGKMSYNDYNTRDMLYRWIDRPQRLWDAVYGTLTSGAETVIHVGPEPNLIPATFKRLADNVEQQIHSSRWSGLGLRAVRRFLGRQWLSALLPSRTSLLRAAGLQHVILEDWLLDNPPPAAK